MRGKEDSYSFLDRNTIIICLISLQIVGVLSSEEATVHGFYVEFILAILCSKYHEKAELLTLLPLGPCGPGGPLVPEGPYMSNKLIIAFDI